MFYQHKLNVSDPEADFWPSPSEVWEALMLRVTRPDHFLPGLAGFRVLSDDGVTVNRELNFGATLVYDRVTRNRDAGWIRFDVARTTAYAGGSLLIELAVQQGWVSLAFTYQTTMADKEASEGVAPSEYVRAAYRASDSDTVRIIRDHIREKPAEALVPGTGIEPV